RFWYQSYLSRELAQLIEKQTLAQIIRRNTGIRGELQDNVFVVRPPMPAGGRGPKGGGRGPR
ncbi:MAG: hypothetical protein KDM63_12985, partial [Verrucomicrobiae bacterium]|nr:hypothetical protein [Verrucomicrobiae bacterium]